MKTIELTMALSLLTIAIPLLAMRLKVMGSSVLIHLVGSHGLGFKHSEQRKGERWAEWIGVLTLNISVAAYAAEHRRHHSNEHFARHDLDPDAMLLFALGFRPGMSVAALWRRFWWTLVSPRFHVMLTVARLRGVFVNGPLQRRREAAWLWGGLLVAAAASGLLPHLLLGFVLPLLVWGNIGAFLELSCEHLWMVAPQVEGRERHALLSHGRFLGAMPPDSQNPLRWARWAVTMAWAMAMRFSVACGDLPHHDSHHAGRRPALKLDRTPWTNAAVEYSPGLWLDEARQRQAVSSVGQAVQRWFDALSQEPPVA